MATGRSYYQPGMSATNVTADPTNRTPTDMLQAMLASELTQRRQPASVTPPKKAPGARGGVGRSPSVEQVEAGRVKRQMDAIALRDARNKSAYEAALQRADLAGPGKKLITGPNIVSGYIEDMSTLPLSLRPKMTILGTTGSGTYKDPNTGVDTGRQFAPAAPAAQQPELLDQEGGADWYGLGKTRRR